MKNNRELSFYFNKRSQLSKKLNSLSDKYTLEQIEKLQNEIKEIDRKIKIINTKWYQRIPKMVNFLVNFLIIGIIGFGTIEKKIVLIMVCALSIIGYIEIIRESK